MNIVDLHNSIRFGRFKCLDTNKVYTVISTASSHLNTQPSYLDKALKAIDIVKRDDGVKKEMTRSELKSRFKNVEQIITKLNK